MLSAFISLLIAFLLFRLILTLWARFVAWLGKGELLERVLEQDLVETQYRASIKEFVEEAKLVRARRKFGKTNTALPTLTREEKRALKQASKLYREQYLDTINLGWYQIVVIFLVGSIAGLILEEIWMYITAGLTESRVGLVWGPFSPLYGFGAVLLTLIGWVLRRRKANNLKVFLVSAATGGVLEQTTGWVMYTYFDAQSWTYAHLPDAITPWIAWRFLFFWGLLGFIWYKAVMGEVLFRIGVPTTKRQVVFVGLLAIYLAFDIFMTMSCFVRKAQRDQGILPNSSFEEWIDKNYTDQFIASRFQNLVIGNIK